MNNSDTRLGGALFEIIFSVVRYRKHLLAITKVDLSKKYSGSVFGKLWIVIYPALLLSIYLFVYLVVFKVRFPGYGEFDFALFVFAGLVPFLGLSESMSSGCVSIKQSIHLVKNVMLPIELVPVKAVAVSMVSQTVSMAILTGLAAFNGNIGPHILWLPVVFALQVMFVMGIVWMLSAVGVIFQDAAYFINLLMLLLIFVSPIGFRPDMVPHSFSFIVYLNPIYYMSEMYRCSILYGKFPDAHVMLVFTAMSLGSFAAGAGFFGKFKDALVDYE